MKITSSIVYCTLFFYCYFLSTPLISQNQTTLQNGQEYFSNGMAFFLGENHHQALLQFEKAYAFYTTSADKNRMFLANLSQKKGLCQIALRKNSEAIKSFQEAINIYNDLGFMETPDIAECYLQLGILFRKKKMFEVSLQKFDAAIYVWKVLYDNKDNEGQVTALACKGITYKEMGQTTEAINQLNKALAIQNRIEKDSEGSKALIISQLGSAYAELFDYDKAKEHFELAIKIMEEEYHQEDGVYLQILMGAGNLYELTGEYYKAEEYLEKALSITKKSWSPKYPEYALAFINLGKLYNSMASYSLADSLTQLGISYLENADFEAPLMHAIALNNSALIYEQLGNYPKAIETYKKSLTILRNSVGESHPDFIQTSINYSTIYLPTGDFAIADSLLFHALETTKKFGDKSYLHAGVLNAIAVLFDHQGNFKEAINYSLEALKILENIFHTKNHPNYAISEINLAKQYLALEDCNSAMPYINHAMTVIKEKSGEYHPYYGMGLILASRCFMKIGDYREAKKLLLKDLTIKGGVYGVNHRMYAISMNNLATFYSMQKKYEESSSLLNKSEKIIKAQLGEKHPEYALLLSNLGLNLFFSNKTEEALGFDLIKKALEIKKNHFIKNLSLIHISEPTRPY